MTLPIKCDILVTICEVTHMAKILIVEDEIAIADLVAIHLLIAG